MLFFFTVNAQSSIGSSHMAPASVWCLWWGVGLSFSICVNPPRHTENDYVFYGVHTYGMCNFSLKNGVITWGGLSIHMWIPGCTLWVGVFGHPPVYRQSCVRISSERHTNACLVYWIKGVPKILLWCINWLRIKVMPFRMHIKIGWNRCCVHLCRHVFVMRFCDSVYEWGIKPINTGRSPFLL